MVQGYSESEATGMALAERAKEAGLDALGGAVSGGVLAGAGIGVNYLANLRQSPQMQENEQTAQPTTIPDIAPEVGEPSGIAAELVNAGATRQQADALSPLLTAVLNGEEISGNQAGMIARSEAAISVLENATGEHIDTDRPLGEVKTAVRSLASRQNTTMETAATTVTSTQEIAPEVTQTVQAETSAEFTPSEDFNQLNAQAVSDFAKTMDKAGATALEQMYNEGQNAEEYIASMIRAYNAGRNGISRTEIVNGLQGVTGEQAQAAYIAGQADAAKAVEKTGKVDYSINTDGLSALSEQLSEKNVVTVDGIRYAIRVMDNGKYTLSIDRNTEAIVRNLDDVLYQYGKGKAHGDVITVLKNGNQEFWKINDPLLLSSVTNMAPKKMDGILDAYAVVSRFMSANITGNNIIWSIFSNFPRDMGTFFTYSKVRNPAKVFAAMGSAYANKIKGDNADPLYKEYLAMGGGQTSAYTADRDLAKKARKSLSSKKFSANPLDWISFVSDTVELGPRFATYKLMRQAGMQPQEAFYEAMDITVNFRRGGEISRQINKVVPFFNASVQGLDKFQRWITASDAPTETRTKVARGRTIAYIAVSAALAALFYGINNGDREAEEDYEQLSNYTKNSYWNIPLGDGKYFAIPKPRDLGVLTSFFETCMEYGIGDNDRAFDDFYSYAADNWLPSVVSDLAQGDFAGAIGSLGIVGVGSYMVANRDFLGRPIVSNSLQYLESKDQYTDRTSKIAYWVGQAFDVSPQMVDYFFSSTLGGWWKAQKALFPVGSENVDYTLGVQNSYIKDNQYSTDLINWLYDQSEASQKAKNSDSGNIGKAITYKMDSNMVTFYSRYYNLSKGAPDTTATRSTRQTVLSMILEYQKATDSGKLTDAQKAVYAICEKAGTTEYLPAVMQSTIKDGNDTEHTLSDVQYVEYQTDYLRLYWEYVEDNLGNVYTQAEKAAVLKAARTVAKEEATNRTLSRIGASQTDYFAKYEGVDSDALISYKAQVDLADDDGSLKQAEIISILELMIANEGLSYEEAYILFHSVYDSDKNNPWAKYAP